MSFSSQVAVTLPGGSPGISRVAGRCSPSTTSWVCPGVSPNLIISCAHPTGGAYSDSLLSRLFYIQSFKMNLCGKCLALENKIKTDLGWNDYSVFT